MLNFIVRRFAYKANLVRFVCRGDKFDAIDKINSFINNIGMFLIVVGCLKTPCSSQDLDSKKMSKVSERRGRSVLNSYIIFERHEASEDKQIWRPPVEIAIFQQDIGDFLTRYFKCRSII